VCSIVGPCRIDEDKHCKDGQSHDHDIGAHDRLDLTPAVSFYEGCIAYVRGIADQADNGIGVGTPINPDADDDDDNK